MNKLKKIEEKKIQQARIQKKHLELIIRQYYNI